MTEITLAQLGGVDNLVKARVVGNIHLQYLNMCQLYQLFLNSYEKKQRLEYLMAMRNLCLEMAEVCLYTNAEPESGVYTQMEQR